MEDNMKVLLTGMTSNQCRPERTSNTFYSGTLALHTVLKENPNIEYSFGNPWDFDFTEFDTVLLGIYAGNALGSSARFPAVAEQLLKVNPENTKVILHLDDWHASSIKNGMNAMRKEKNVRRLMKMFHPKADDYEFENIVANIVTWCEDIRTGRRTYPVLLPMLGWRMNKVNVIGESMGLTGSSFIPYDYCAAFDPIELPDPPKERGWVLATKYDYNKYIEEKKFTWPVIRYGCKKNGDNYLPNEEDVIREAYTKYWGLISHPYHPKLRGQGRDKFMLATWTRSIIISEPGENDNMPEYSVSVSEIEKMSDKQLEDLAERQRIAYLTNSWSRYQLQEFVKGLIK